jgi:hypothetical protein
VEQKTAEEETHPCILETIRRRQLLKLRLHKRLIAPSMSERDDLEVLLAEGVGLEGGESGRFGRHEEDARFRRGGGFDVEGGVEVRDGGQGIESSFTMEGDVAAVNERELETKCKGRKRNTHQLICADGWHSINNLSPPR